MAVFLILLAAVRGLAETAEGNGLLTGHPRPSYENVRDIDAMAAALRRSLAGQESYSFSRGWWTWDRLRCRYVDGGRKNAKELKILSALVRGVDISEVYSPQRVVEVLTQVQSCQGRLV